MAGVRGRFRLLALGALLGVLLFASVASPASATSSASVHALDDVEAALVGKLNELRRSKGLDALRPSGSLERAADVHARAMARLGFFSHSSQDGTSAARRVQRYFDGARVGETILWRSPGVDADRALDMWVSSPPHRQILLSRSFEQIGIRAVHVTSGAGVYGGLPVTIVVADFGGG
jgi:uncharacterized protein YkwD